MKPQESSHSHLSSTMNDTSPFKFGYDLPSFLNQVAKMVVSWPDRAAVKKEELDTQALYKDELPDFLLNLLPFNDHPNFVRASDELKQRVLSCGWLAYNEKTIAVETKIISPACMHVIDGDIPGLSYEVCREALAQVFVDEAYHTLLLVNACRVTRQRRGLEALRIPDFTLIENMRASQDQQPERWKKILIQLICATVSEVSISDYLGLLSGATSIQPLNMITTEIHRRDEAAHASVFKKIAQMAYLATSAEKREFFVQNLPKPVVWFSSLELGVWHSMLDQIGFPDADRMLKDCATKQEYDVSRRDFSALSEMLHCLGIDPTKVSEV